MKKVLVFLVALLGLALNAVAGEGPAVKFDKTSYDFGTFSEEKGKVTHVFEFTNTGKEDLVLQDVKTSCGCTTPDWTKTPIAPGKKGKVEVTYNSTGRPGQFTKTITVTSNAGVDRLQIKGEVLLKRDADKLKNEQK